MKNCFSKTIKDHFSSEDQFEERCAVSTSSMKTDDARPVDSSILLWKIPTVNIKSVVYLLSNAGVTVSFS
jgi:hypothetical protein